MFLEVLDRPLWYVETVKIWSIVDTFVKYTY